MSFITKSFLPLLIGSFILSSLALQAQNCEILFPSDPQLESKTRSYRDVSQSNSFYADWTSIENGIIKDDQFISVQMDPNEQSEILRLSNFNLNIPEHSIIEGITLIVNGNADGEVNDVMVQLANPYVIGTDVSQYGLNASRWPSMNGDWRYGSSWFTWNANVDADILNDKDFGILLQIKNDDGNVVTASIDKVELRIHFKRPYEVCLEHSCIIASTQESPGIDSYDWDIPNDFSVISQTDDESLIIFVPHEENAGTFEICVSPQGPGLDYSCCSYFTLKDCRPGSIGDFVWNDLNGNGIQDGEPGIPGIFVTLYDDAGNFIDITVSDANGFYSFHDIPSGEYYIQVGFNSNFILTSSNAGNDVEDSDITEILGINTSDYFLLQPGEIKDDLDIGLLELKDISGLLWEDLNADGIRTPNEPLLVDFEVNLFDGNNNFLDKVTTNGSGEFLFADLLQTSYSVRITPISTDFMNAPVKAGSNENVDSDFDLNGIFNISMLDDDIKIDAGYFRFAKLSGFVWLDYNRNGNINNEDEGLDGIGIDILDSAGNIIYSTTTDMGNYALVDLMPGNYTVQVSVPNDFIPTLDSPDNTHLDFNGTEYTVDVLLNSNQDIQDLFFGFQYKPSTISGYAWIDDNGDGFSGGEPRFPNVAVNLKDENGLIVQSQSTQNNGEYSFDNLNPGTYYVDFDLPTGLFFTLENGDSKVNNNIEEGATALITIAADQNVDNINAGYFEFSSIGDYVWMDLDRDGIQDADEQGIPNLMIRLINTTTNIINVINTDSDGMYLFDFLSPGSYTIYIEKSADLIPTTPSQGNGQNDSEPLSDNGSFYESNGFIVSSGFNSNNEDFGFQYVPSSISGYAWHDINGNGLNQSEPILDNITVQLFDENDNLIATENTDNQGNYQFQNINPGVYYIVFDNPNDLNFTITGGDSSVESNSVFGATNNVSVGAGQNIDNINAGYFIYSSIGDYIWTDFNRDGIQDANEVGIPNLMVRLINTTTNIINVSNTDATGKYLFDFLSPGTYALYVEKPTDLIPTTPLQGNGQNDSKPLADNGIFYESNGFMVSSDSNSNDEDFGFQFIPSSISGYTWHDINGNGLNQGEPILDNITVQLFDENDNLIATDDTDNQGNYEFQNINPGVYYIVFDNPNDLNFTITGGDSSVENNSVFGATNNIAVGAGQNIDDINAGYFRFAQLGDYVWLDDDGNGIQDANENGIDGVIISIINVNTGSSMSTLTSSNGAYSFSDLTPGEYKIAILKDPTLQLATANSGNGTNDSRMLTDLVTIYETQAFDILSGSSNLNWDFGFELIKSNISGLAWIDYNADGINDIDEDAQPNIEVTLFDNLGNQIETTSTAADGTYLFDDIIPGIYYVTFEAFIDQIFSPPTNDSDVTGSLGVGSTDLFILMLNTDITDLDAGYFGYSSIGDFVWLDVNSNGIQDVGEPGIADVEIELFDANGVLIDNQMTDADGFYQFSNLLPDDYYLVFNIGSDFTSSPPNIGNSTEDSDVVDVFGTGSTTVFSLGYLENNLTIDAGFRNVVGSVQGEVFLDGDANGLNQFMDVGYLGVEVILRDDTNALIQQTTTGADGIYQFLNVMPGNYYVEFVVPNDFQVTMADVGSDDSIDSDVTNANGGNTTDVFTLNPQDVVTDIDLGIYEFVSIGNQVWLDENEDGLNNNNEVGFPDVLVGLINQNGSTIDTEVTDQDGFYLFTDVTPGMYQLRFDMPADYQFTIPDVGADESIDSDADNASGNLGFTNPFMLASGMDTDDIDAGVFLIESGKISGLVWEDLNADGIQDANEMLIENLVVELYSAAGVLLNTTMTDNMGFYEFMDISNGDVFVEFKNGSGQLFSPANVGSDDMIDSDVTQSQSSQSTDLLTIINTSDYQNVNAGLYELASIGDMVWEDLNMDGIQDANETGVNNVLVELVDANGMVVNSMNTSTINGVDGKYTFDDVVPGTYVVAFNPNGNYVFSMQNAGMDPSLDSDVIVTGAAIGSTPPITLISGEVNEDVDAGISEQEEFDISGFAFTDENGNGLKDIGDTYENGIVVNLFDDMGNLVDTQTTMTDANGIDGYYSFMNVAPDQYYVEFILPSGNVITLANQGTNDALDSDLTGANGTATSDLIDVTNSAGVDLVCGGFYEPVTIGDYLWSDLISNGIQDASEEGVNGIMVRLYDASGSVVDFAFTQFDGNGNMGFYQFLNVAPGDYFIRFALNASMSAVAADQGMNDTIDSDITNANGSGTTDIYSFVSGETNVTIDAGVQMDPADVGDFVWIDFNGDGIQDPDEPGLENVMAELFDEFGMSINTTTSDTEGFYIFNDVPPGNYYIVFTPPAEYMISENDQGGDDTKDSDIMNTITMGATNIFNLNAGEFDMDIDGGFFIPSKLGNFVWDDLNKNGLQDAGEPGIEGVKVDLRLGSFFVLATTETDANGFYEFDALKQGGYSLKFYDIPAGYQFSPMDVGTDDTIDSDPFPSNGETAIISLAHGVDLMVLDAGLFDPTANEPPPAVEITFWPNPATDYVTHYIKSEIETTFEWTIITAFGQKIRSGNEGELYIGNNRFIMDVRGIQPGTYFVKYEMEGFYLLRSLIIN